MRIFIFIAFILSSFPVSAQYRQPYFHTISVENGLVEANVHSIVNDHLGYMWLGTQNGVMRYDGYSLIKYDIPDENGNPSVLNYLTTLFEDSKNILWNISFQDGIFYLDRKKNAFVEIPIDSTYQAKFENARVYWQGEDKENYVFLFAIYDYESNKSFIQVFDPVRKTILRYGDSEKGKYYIPEYNNLSIAASPKGQIWMNTHNVLYKYNSGTSSFDSMFTLPGRSGNIRFNDLLPDPAEPDIIWISTTRTGESDSGNPVIPGLFQFNSKTKLHKVFTPDLRQPDYLPSECLAIMPDSLNRIWISTKKGISMYNRDHASFTNYPIPVPLSPWGQEVTISTIAADQAGNVWMGGYFKGLFFLDIAKGTPVYYEHNKEKGALPDYFGIRRIFFDRSRKLWIDIPYYGISSLEHEQSLFNPIRIHPNHTSKTGPLENENFNIVGAYGDSLRFVKSASDLFLWNYVHNTFTRIEISPSDFAGLVSYIHYSNDGTLWIGSGSGGLMQYDPHTKRSKIYTSQQEDTTSLSSNQISVITEDASGNLYIGTGSGGLCRFNKNSATFTRFPYNADPLIRKEGDKSKNELDDESVLSLFIDDEGIIWAGTNLGGLNKFDPKNGRFTSYLDLKAGLTCVINIYKDHLQRLWAGTYLAGLFLVDPETGTFKRYGEKEGLLHNYVAGIRDDSNGNLWVHTPRGLSKLDKNGVSFTNFPMPLPTANNRDNMIRNGINGDLNLFFDGGLISVNPRSLQPNPVTPSVVIESITYPDRQVSVSGPDTLVYLTENDIIKLAYNENKIRFQYVALHFANPAANQYSFKLDGYDYTWQHAGTQRSITYTNLSPGTYTFHVKASNSDGVWNEEGTSVTIIILPPWWKTWWAYILYALLFLGGLRVFSKWRERNLRQTNEALEHKVAERTASLKTTLDHLKSTQAQLIQSEKMASLGELTAGIAHEIQNPLNFVNNFSEVNTELIDEMQHELKTGNTTDAISISNSIKENEEKINYHGKRADAIVKGMLQHSRSSSGVKEPTDINALCDEYLRLAYHGLRAKDKSFNATMKTDFDETIGLVNVIPQDIGRVILNLITNAFHAVCPPPPEGGLQTPNGVRNPTVIVQTKTISPLQGVGGKTVEISVRDNGPGIPDSIKDKIFQPFFTTKPTGQGTGLGLSLSYDIIKAHGGDLRVETKAGEFAEFIITLPT